MEVVIKVSALAVFGAIIIVSLRRTVPELSVTASVALLAVLVLGAVGALGRVVTLIYDLAAWASIDDKLVEPIVKTLGISIVSRLASDMCRESGVQSAASYVELVGGAVAVSFAIPLMFGLLSQITM
ncbi:MAG: hypothetical protein IKM21_05930 [Oscillospiraceae bacterium]|nr:hypothetical protein [Oscillospiraceae bacterium]